MWGGVVVGVGRACGEGVWGGVRVGEGVWGGRVARAHRRDEELLQGQSLGAWLQLDHSDGGREGGALA